MERTLANRNRKIMVTCMSVVVQCEMTIKAGETVEVFYRPHNTDDQSVTGRANFNAAPYKAGKYSSKIDCFCATEQPVASGQSIDMPVEFYVDPAIDGDLNLEEVTTSIRSYTFYPVNTDEVSEKTALLASPALNPVH
jgi:cytochrome c oxidase assembly protein subunit 11